MEKKTAVEVMAERSYDDQRTQSAIQRLLYRLDEFIAVRGMTKEADDQLSAMNAKGDIAAVWMTGPDGDGPIKVLHQALLETPELWARFLPPEVCIVRRDMLKTLADCVPISIDPKRPFGGPIPLEMMESAGREVVDRYAHVARRIREDREHREDKGRIRALEKLYDDYHEPQ